MIYIYYILRKNGMAGMGINLRGGAFGHLD